MARDYAVTLRAMLKKSEGTDNEHERDTFFNQALTFAAKHGIDIAMLEEETSDNLVISKRFGFRKPFAIDKGRLWSIISRHFNCRSVIYPGNVYRTYGYNSDLGLADTLFDLLWEHGCSELGEAEVPFYVSGRSFSTAFWAGYQNKIRERLDLAKNVAIAETTGAELVLVSRENAVQDELTKNHPHLKFSRTRRTIDFAGYNAGTMAGERASLGHPIQNG